MASVRELAQQTGVSAATVSRVLNNHPSVSEAIRGRVLRAANKNNYRMTTSRVTAMSIGYVYTGAATLSSPFDAALLAGIGEALEDTPYALTLFDAQRLLQPGEAYSHLFMRHQLSGVILRSTSGSYAACETIAAEDFPAVMVGSRSEDPRVSYLYSDSLDASREAVEHLIGLGHRRIALATNVFDDPDHLDRLAGYRRALESHGLTFEPGRVIRLPARRSSGDQVIRRLVDGPDRPTAVYIADPAMAVGTLNAAAARGVRVPEDLSIVGFDDTELRHNVYPRMTVVCQDAASLGRFAVQALAFLIDDPDRKPRREALRTWLEIHDTTGPVRPEPADRRATDLS